MLLQLSTGNAKLGRAATTYAPIRNTCPTSCPLMGEGCYGQSGPVAIHGKRLESSLEGLSPEVCALIEAGEIVDAARRMRDPFPLRLHTFGDCRTTKAARILSEACRRWMGPVWTYTHAWRDVPREAWGKVSVLASCEGFGSAAVALDAGYAPAVVVPDHPADGKAYMVGDMRVIPCPNQTRDLVCSQCRLCFDDKALLTRRAVISFAVHGAGYKRAKRRLDVLR